MRLIKATQKDAQYLLELHNANVEHFFSKKKVSLSDHLSWFQKAKNTQDIYIAIVNKQPVGVIRAQDSYLSYTVDQQHRCKGYASAMIQAFCAFHQQRPVRAQILHENIASAKAVQKAGFVLEYETLEYSNFILQ